MRIISGVYKGRKLISPDSDMIRPTSDRAKETLFNILNNRINFEGMLCLDLFCGTGNLGLECISRGASMCYFVDKKTELVTKNIALLGVQEKSKVIKSDAVYFLNSASSNKFDLVFCDPPYDFGDYETLIERIAGLKSEVILEHPGKFELDPQFDKYVYVKKKVGAVNFTLFDFGNEIGSDLKHDFENFTVE
ncbi:MAG: RsmD family RNA methyltransferase [Bacteroidota bacterium]|nr:RsmD family RNA methyltransferase [Bacteroidota bacterium]